MRFLLFYGGVFALVGLTAAVGAGLIASDRIIMTPSNRIIAQAVHRAISFGAVGFLVIHIVTEVIAGRAESYDAVVPFVGHPRTLYLGMGTLAADLFLLILVTGIMRGRFVTIRPQWAWRAVHASAYLAWPLAILHGLLDGRTAKPYVDWSYGACVAAVGLALIVRLVVPPRVQETASSPVPEAPPWLPPPGGAGVAGWQPLGRAGVAGWQPLGGAGGATASRLSGAPVSALGGPPVSYRAPARRPPLALPAPPQAPPGPQAASAYPGHSSAYPGHSRGYPDHSGGYPPTAGAMVYYPRPDDQDDGAEWPDAADPDADDLDTDELDTEDLDIDDLDADDPDTGYDDDPEPDDEEYDPEWAGTEVHPRAPGRPGPGWPGRRPGSGPGPGWPSRDPRPRPGPGPGWPGRRPGSGPGPGWPGRRPGPGPGWPGRRPGPGPGPRPGPGPGPRPGPGPGPGPDWSGPHGDVSDPGWTR